MRCTSSSCSCPSALGIALLLALLCGPGCSRRHYRVQADQEAYATIAERNVDPRWNTHNVSIEIDPDKLDKRTSEVFFKLETVENDVFIIEEARFLGPLPLR